MNRYEKQILFSQLGEDGQKKLLEAKVGVLGCGALGTNISNLLARAGVGTIVIADKDDIELSNLHRQMLFNESDIGKSKALTAAEKLKAINSQININAQKIEVTQSNFYGIYNNCQLIMDATDNFDIRFTLNSQCLKHNITWIHSGVTAASGQSMLIKPNETACYGCLIPENTHSDTFPGINSDGIISTIVCIIASISVTTALKTLLGPNIDNYLTFYDAWNNHFSKIKINRNKDCKYCSSQSKKELLDEN